MLKRYRSAAIGCAALLTAGSLSWAAGNWSTLPVLGGPSFCASTVTGISAQGGNTGQGQGTGAGSVCAQTVPAGPPLLTGSETVPADTNQGPNTPTQTVSIPAVMFGAINAHINGLVGGDFATNAWQRGTTPISATTVATTTMGPDRFGVYSSGNTVTVTKQTAAADSLPTLGLNASARINRPSGTDVTQISIGQTLDQEASQRFIGNNMVCSFYALAGAGFTAASSNLNATIAYYTAADSATPGTNTDAFMKATITGYQAATAGVSTQTTGTIASGIASIPISTTWTRYSVYAPIPTANASGTAVTGVGFTVGYKPVGTGVASDWFEIEGVQCQAMPSQATASLVAGVTSPTGFERRPVALEQSMEYYYSWGLKEPAAGTLTSGVPALCSASGAALIGIALPQTMRAIPTLTLTAGGWKIQTAVAQTAIGTTTVVSGSTAQQVTLTSGAACTATLPYQLVGTSTTGLIMLSAEP